MEDLWCRWEYVVDRILYEFNEDVFGGNGFIRKNPYYEMPYVVVENKKLFLCIFPLQGNTLLFISSRGVFKNEYLKFDYSRTEFGTDHIIAFDKIDLEKAERRCSTTDDKFCYMECAVKIFYKRHWSALSA
jgi:hypothetical protein